MLRADGFDEAIIGIGNRCGQLDILAYDVNKCVKILMDQGMTEEEARSQTAERIGSALGDVLRQTVDRSGLKRVATTGGDTSYYVAKQMGVTALEAVAPLAPGSPLCKVHSTVPAVDGCEVTFKGGQVGKVGFFGQVLAGK